MKKHKTQTAPNSPMVWIFSDAYVGQASRLSSNDIRPQARRPRYIPEAQKRSGFGISIRTIIAASLFAALPVASATEEAPKEAPKATPKEESLEAYNNRMQWFVDSPYGMFIHFGLYSTIGGIWQGKPIDHYAEWIQGTANIDRHEYAELAKEFNPKDFDADLIVRSAKEAGMDYLVITAKHHEGFCLWDSQYTEFDVASTPFKGRDILEELRQACQKYGIKFGLYYSIIDWNHPTQKRPSELGKKASPGQTVIVDNRKQEYVDYQKNQVLELLHKYDPAVLWFDGDWVSWWTMADGIALYNAIREASPHVIVNNRVAKRDGYELDFVTQEQGHFKDAFPKHWEGCYTMNKFWGYKKNDNNWTDAQTIYDKLKDINEKGGNLLLNVGPDGNGVVQPEAYAILKETAELLKANPIHKKIPQITSMPGVIEKQAKPKSEPAKEWIIETQADWEECAPASEGIEFRDAMAVPTAPSATIRSKIKTFEQKQSPRSLVVSQSPVWDNWTAVPKIAPPNLDDAPVLLSKGPGDYWIFGWYRNKNPAKDFTPKEATLEGFNVPLQTTQWPNQFNAPGGLKKSLGGYHAWQSRDMVNWVHHGPVGDGRAKWMTTAEFVDGKAYLYYDFPNDADPHLIIDEDLTDGIPGKDMGMVFKDPSRGSDCAIIRDLDGKFHLISEDWSPIDASKHAWDSPLASHAVSDDGLGNFKLLAPPVDQRTKPTGKTGTFLHPHWTKEDPENYPSNVAEYEIHEPEQNAYGDWAAIAIGGQYYLFADFEPAGSKKIKGQLQMSIARFTSSDINKPFTFCGSLGSGHPDPDICFAEGRFYLINQTKNDYISPGPWVEKVEARVGVDTDNDGKINDWTPWQEVQEKYEYIPGFSKQVAKTPAALDLSKLPAGNGFQIELKTTDTTGNGTKPILDKLALSFAECATGVRN